MVDRSRHYSAVLRFVLIDPEGRLFMAERMSYRGDCRWMPVERAGGIGHLAARLVPKLGTDDFFELL